MVVAPEAGAFAVCVVSCAKAAATGFCDGTGGLAAVFAVLAAAAISSVFATGSTGAVAATRGG